MKNKKKILIIEDEVKIARFVELELQYEGYCVEVAHDGKTGLALFEKETFDLVILDWMLPGFDGMEVLAEIRKISETPVIMLTAKSEVLDKVSGLDSGADDYITKPFAIEELLARMRVALKKSTLPTEWDHALLHLKNLTVDVQRRIVKISEETIDLTKTEFELLLYLIRNKNIVMTRERILSQVWGYEYLGETNVVDVYVRYLRMKLDDRFQEKYVHTVRGVGYIVKDGD